MLTNELESINPRHLCNSLPPAPMGAVEALELPPLRVRFSYQATIRPANNSSKTHDFCRRFRFTKPSASLALPAMSLINGQDLLDAGWQPGAEIGQALAKAQDYEARGISDKKYLLKLLARDVPKSKPKQNSVYSAYSN